METDTMRSDSDTDQHRRRFLTAIGIASSGAFLAGCAGSDSQETTTAEETTTQAETEGENTPQSTGGELTAGTRLGELSTLDPAHIERDAEIQLLVNLYNGLIQLNNQLEPEPDLAKDWEWVSNTEVVFNLREGVQFHNGDTLTAEDVKFSFERILDKETGSPWRDQLTAINEITVDDDTTVTFQLGESFAPLEAVIVRKNMAGCILSKEAIEGGVDPATKAIGTGPFQLANWESGAGVELERFDNYWKPDVVNLDSVSVEFIPDPTTLITALEANDVGMVDTVPGQDLKRLKGNSNIQVYESAGVNVRYIGFNAREDSVFSDKRVRQAASLAINRESLTQVLGPEFQPNRSPIPQTIEWAHQKNLPMQSQDTAQAQKLLEEAGATGASISLNVWQEDPWRQIATVAQNMMNEVGFNVEIKVFEFGTFWERVTEQGNYDAFVLGWTGLTDPDQYMYAQFTTDGSWNWMGYSNSQLDKILKNARQETDRSKRSELYGQAQKIVAEDAVYACLASEKDFQASRSYVKGYDMPPTGTLLFENVYLDR